MAWIFFALIGYALLAVVGVTDKFFLSKYFKNPTVYAVYVGFLGVLALIIWPWWFAWPGYLSAGVALVAGAVFIFALHAMFQALIKGEASRVLPVIGGLIPLFTLVISYLWLDESLTYKQAWAFSLLVGGVLLVAGKQGKSQAFWRVWLWVVVAALGMAINYSVSKYLFLHIGPVNGFLWLRVGSFIGAVFLLWSPATRRVIKQHLTNVGTRIKFLFLGEQLVGGVGFVSLNYAIYLASVALVNALQGAQYILILVITIFLSLKYPSLIKEKLSARIITQKALALVLLTVGFIMLFL